MFKKEETGVGEGMTTSKRECKNPAATQQGTSDLLILYQITDRIQKSEINQASRGYTLGIILYEKIILADC